MERPDDTAVLIRTAIDAMRDPATAGDADRDPRAGSDHGTSAPSPATPDPRPHATRKSA
jgi:hypothetical protein